MFWTWQMEKASGNAVGPFAGLPQTAEDVAPTFAVGIPRTSAKKSETESGGAPFSAAVVFTTTLRPVVSRVTERTLLLPSSAFWLASVAAKLDVVHRVSVEFRAHFWATPMAAASAPFC